LNFIGPAFYPCGQAGLVVVKYRRVKKKGCDTDYIRRTRTYVGRMFVLLFLVFNMVFLGLGKTRSLPDGGKKK